MADPSVGWCGRLSPCLHVQPWPPTSPPCEPTAPPLPPPSLPSPAEPDPDPAIERLLALYAAGPGSESLIDDDADASQCSSASEEILSNQDLTLDKALIARELLGECDPASDCADGEPAAKRPCRAGAVQPCESPAAPPPAGECEPYHRSVSVGAEHQAELPTLRPAAGRRRSRPCADRLLWDPSRLSEQEVERYQRRLRPSVVSALRDEPPPPAPRLPDHEQALYELQEAGHDVESAARRLTAAQLRPPGRLSHWSEHERCLFERALRLHGKDFATIRRVMLPTRSVGEIVHFYYLWKKTESHRQFLADTQLDKRKYGPEPSLSDHSSPCLPAPASSSLQILMATDPWEHGAWATEHVPSPGGPAHHQPQPQQQQACLVSLLASCPQLLLP